jgi:UDPglucose 6-dehydrogenase
MTRFGGKLAGRQIAVWGLAFKQNTDDMREASSQVLIEELIANGASVTAYDPVAIPAAKGVFGGLKGIRFAESPLAALDGADALAIVTEWQEFRSPDFQAIRARLKTPVVFDGRNLYDPAELKRRGLEYYPIGRAAVKAGN